MTADINRLPAALEAQGIMGGCVETRDAVSRCCHFFRESGSFNPIPSYQEIGTIINLDAKTGLDTLGQVPPGGQTGRATTLPILWTSAHSCCLRIRAVPCTGAR
jgi:hypothetical protein